MSQFTARTTYRYTRDCLVSFGYFTAYRKLYHVFFNGQQWLGMLYHMGYWYLVSSTNGVYFENAN